MLPKTKPSRNTPESPDHDADLIDDLYSDKTNLTHFTWHASTDRPSTVEVPEYLKEYEGSYSFDDLQSGRNEPLSFLLQSSWITTGSNTPQVSVRMRKSQQSGQLEVRGTELYLPKTGFGISYEQDEEADDTKAFLNMKRQF